MWAKREYWDDDMPDLSVDSRPPPNRTPNSPRDKDKDKEEEVNTLDSTRMQDPSALSVSMLYRRHSTSTTPAPPHNIRPSHSSMTHN